jgi:hypothetical protein
MYCFISTELSSAVFFTHVEGGANVKFSDALLLALSTSEKLRLR